jgi:hypothetical protein
MKVLSRDFHYNHRKLLFFVKNYQISVILSNPSPYLSLFIYCSYSIINLEVTSFDVLVAVSDYERHTTFGSNYGKYIVIPFLATLSFFFNP